MLEKNNQPLLEGLADDYSDFLENIKMLCQTRKHSKSHQQTDAQIQPGD